MTVMTLRKLPPIFPLRILVMCAGKSGACVQPEVEFIKSGDQNRRVFLLRMTLRVKSAVGSPRNLVIDST